MSAKLLGLIERGSPLLSSLRFDLAERLAWVALEGASPPYPPHFQARRVKELDVHKVVLKPIALGADIRLHLDQPPAGAIHPRPCGNHDDARHRTEGE